MLTITAHTRPSGTVAVEAHDDGRKVAERITRRTYPFLVIYVWQHPDRTATTLKVSRATGNYDTARQFYGEPGVTVLRRHTDGTYTAMDTEWNARQAIVRRQEAEARWDAERRQDRHQVLVHMSDGRVVRIGDPTRHFTYDQALARVHELDPEIVFVRSEADPTTFDVPWADGDDLRLIATLKAA